MGWEGRALSVLPNFRNGAEALRGRQPAVPCGPGNAGLCPELWEGAMRIGG